MINILITYACSFIDLYLASLCQNIDTNAISLLPN
uniref:Uncharacterized protein n=1 Tax=Geladintestivirus 4 TaxID=3233136 RepID=A0AAU8MHR0_9CAUD